MICLTQFMPRLTGREEKNVMIRKLRFTVGVLTLSCLGVFVPSMVFAQHGPGRHVADKQEPPAYDTNSEATFNGTVSDVTTGRAAETQLFLNTDTGAIPIHLGPTVFLSEKKVEIRKGDRLQVTGSRVTIGDTQIVLAREIRKGDETWMLRDAAGQPLWTSGPTEARGFWTKKRVLVTALVLKVAGLAVMLSR